MGDDDAPIRYDAIHEIACALAQKTNPSFRGSPADRSEIASLVEKLRQHAPRAPATKLSLAERVKRIYPVVHRAYDLFIGTKQCDKKVDVREVLVEPGWFRKKEVQLRVADNPFQKLDWPDCGVAISLYEDSDTSYDSYYYIISRFRPTWKRCNASYNMRQVTKRFYGSSAKSDACIDICSPYFEINCLLPKDFVRSLAAGGSEPHLRQATLDHLLSLPEILGPYLDRKERRELALGR